MKSSKSKTRKISLSMALLAMLSLIVVVCICIKMSSETLDKKNETALELFLNAKSEFLCERIQGMKNFSSVISNRTAMREDFERYLEGKISQAEYQIRFKTKLKDSIKLVSGLIGITRYTLGNEKTASYGEELTDNILNGFSKNVPVALPATLSNGKRTLAVISPIFSGTGDLIGKDVAVFNPDLILESLDSSKGIGHFHENAPYALLSATVSGKALLFIPEELRCHSAALCDGIAALAKTTNFDRRPFSKVFDGSDYFVYERKLLSDGNISYSIIGILEKKSLFAERKEEIAIFGIFIALFSLTFYLILSGRLYPVISRHEEYIRTTEDLNKRLKNEILKHEKSESLLKDSEMRFRAFMENIPGLVFVKDDEGRFAYMNDYFKIRKYADTEKWLGKTDTEVWPVSGASPRAKTQEKILGGSAVASSIECLKLKGEYKYFAVYRFPIVSEQYKKSYGGVAFEVSDLLDLESELMKQKEQLSLTLHSISDGVVVTDKNCQITIANKVASEILECPKDELIGKKIFEMLHIFSPADGRKYLADTVEKILLSPHKKEKFTIETHSGARKQIICSYSPVIDQERETIGYVMVFKDVTADEKMRDFLARSQKFESIGTLAGGIAHDFNNVLEAVVGNIGLAKMICGNNPELAEILEDAETATDRAKDISNRLLMFSKGGLPVAEECDTRKLVETTVPMALTGADAKLYINIQDDVWNVFVDDTLAAQAILNIATNARQAVPQEGGIVEVSAANVEFDGQDRYATLRPGAYVCISFKDNGTGIAPASLDKVFDPYYTTKPGAQGLGLTLAYSIVSKQNGTIEIENNAGESGVTCKLFLPAKKFSARQKTATKTALMPAPAEKLPRQKILVMDDEESILKILRTGLEKLGQEVVLTRRGEDAIAEYKKSLGEQNPFDIVILDITVVGGMGGRETIKALKEINPDIVAVVSSGYSADNVMHLYQEHGFKYSLPKPYTLAALKELLHLIAQDMKGKKNAYSDA